MFAEGQSGQGVEMFAVPGWSVSAASLKPQVASKSSKAGRDADEQKVPRKRKRGSDAPGPAIGTDDLGKLWERHVEGKAQPKKDRREKKHRDRPEKRQEIRHAHGFVTLEHDVNGFKRRKDRKEKHANWNQKTVKVHSGPDDIVQGTRKEKRRKLANAAESVPGAGEDTFPQQAPAEEKKKKKKEAPSKQPPPPPTPLPAATKLTPMQSAMRQKLVSARFRHLNETLYTAPSTTAQRLFADNPELFEHYHAGFRQQLAVWPANPLDAFIRAIEARGSKDTTKNGNVDNNDNNHNAPPLPRTRGTATIADLGCGDARLAHTLTSSNATSALLLKILSYDLHARSRHVVAADIAALPLADGGVDVALLCLALMGTNWIEFVEEAWRVLRWGGELWVAEIRSRFGCARGEGRKGMVRGSRRSAKRFGRGDEARTREREEGEREAALRTAVDGVVAPGGEAAGVAAFVAVLARRGFVLREGGEGVDQRNRMFVSMEFVKARAPSKGRGRAEGETRAVGATGRRFGEAAGGEPDVDSADEASVLGPCLYKVR